MSAPVTLCTNDNAPVTTLNPLPVTGSFTISSVTVNSSAEATAAAPTYSEAANADLSQDLKGNLRVKLPPLNAASLTNAAVSFSSSGDNTIVSGTASQTVRVHRLCLVAAAPVTITLKSNATGLTGAIPLGTNGSINVDFTAEPEFVTASAEAFIATLSAAVAVTGYIGYIKSA